MFRKTFSSFAIFLCSFSTALFNEVLNPSDALAFPKSQEEKEDERIGSMTGSGGLVLFQTNKNSDNSKNTTNKQNATNTKHYDIAWDAALDIVKHMPLLSIDKSAGTILTDWNKTDNNDNDRTKYNIFISKTQNFPQNITVIAFKQKLTKNSWEDIGEAKDAANTLRDKIIKHSTN